MKPRDILRISQGCPAVDSVAASQQGPPGRPFLETGEPHIQPRLVGKIGAAADEYHVAVRALAMNVAAGILAGDPFRFARGQSDLAVDREGELERNPRPPELQPREPATERALRRIAGDAAPP